MAHARRAGARTLLLALVAGAAPACGSEAATLDRAATQRQVGRAVAAEVQPNVASTICPEELPKERGGRFLCTVQLGGDAGELEVEVVQLDDEGRLEVTAAAAVRSDAELAAEVRAALRERFERSFQVDCGEGPAKVREPGDELVCRARDAGGPREVTVTVVDASGNLQVDVGDDPADDTPQPTFGPDPEAAPGISTGPGG